MTTSLEQLTSALQPFIGSGEFRIVEARHDADSFGNAILVAESQALRMKVVVDRSQVFAEIGGRRHEEMWFDLVLVLIALEKDLHEPLPWTNPHDVMSLLLANREGLAQFVASDLDVIRKRLRDAESIDRGAYSDALRSRRSILDRS